MKTSTFLTKVLKSFNNGKSYSSTGAIGRNGFGDDGDFVRQPIGIAKTAKNYNLMQAIDKFGMIYPGQKGDAQLSIAFSLGHANLVNFQTHGYKKVEAVLKAAIKRERRYGN